MNTTATPTAPAGYETRAYDGPIFKRGDVVRYVDSQGIAITTRVKRVVLKHSYYDPSVVVERYLVLEDIERVLVPSSQCTEAGAR